MLRAIGLAVLMIVAVQASVAMAQEKPPAQQAPSRDCERSQQGVGT